MKTSSIQLKFDRMKQATTIISFLFCSMIMIAQNKEKAPKEMFTPSWNIGLYSGANWFLGEYNTPFTSPNTFSFRNNGSPISSIAFGYEFSPIIDLRTQIGWARYQWTNTSNVHFISWGANLTEDLMINLNNWWGGYNPNRIFDVQAFGGLGIGYRTKSEFSSSLITPIVHAGIQGNFHLSKQFDLNVELANYFISDKMNDFTGQVFHDDFTTLQLGFTYHFRKSSLPTSSVGVPKPEIKIKEVIKHDTVYIVEKPKTIEIEVPKSLHQYVFFPIGVSKIIDYNQQQTIEEMAKFLQKYPNAKLQIDGYADKDTGGKARNMELSLARAKNIAQELIKKYNIDPSRIKTMGHGTVPQIFQINNKNRVATLNATATVKEQRFE